MTGSSPASEGTLLVTCETFADFVERFSGHLAPEGIFVPDPGGHRVGDILDLEIVREPDLPLISAEVRVVRFEDGAQGRRVALEFAHLDRASESVLRSVLAWRRRENAPVLDWSGRATTTGNGGWAEVSTSEIVTAVEALGTRSESPPTGTGPADPSTARASVPSRTGAPGSTGPTTSSADTRERLVRSVRTSRVERDVPGKASLVVVCLIVVALAAGAWWWSTRAPSDSADVPRPSEEPTVASDAPGGVSATARADGPRLFEETSTPSPAGPRTKDDEVPPAGPPPTSAPGSPNEGDGGPEDVAPALDVDSDEGPSPTDRELVTAALSAWAEAWSAQDVEAYLGAYVPSYSPPGTTSELWRAKRRERVTAPAWIRVSFPDPEIRRLGDDRFEVLFEQTYESDGYSDRTPKRVEMTRGPDGRWRIAVEESR